MRFTAPAPAARCVHWHWRAALVLWQAAGLRRALGLHWETFGPCPHNLCCLPGLQEEATWSESEGEWATDDEDADMAEAGGDDSAGPSCSSHTHHHHHQHEQQQQQGCGESTAAAAAGGGDQAAPAEGQADAAYINLFLLKYVCPREGCYGTLAPLAPAPQAPHSAGAAAAAAAAADTLYECNMCGGRRSEAEFLAELEAAD